MRVDNTMKSEKMYLEYNCGTFIAKKKKKYHKQKSEKC